MELNLKELLEKIEPLKRLLSKELPVKTAYRLGRLSNAIQNELQQYDLHRNNLIKKYGKEKDGQFMIDKDDKEGIEKFAKDHDELISVNCKIDSYNPITLDELGDIKISPMDIGSLEVFFKSE